jgi:ornithine cyclodeaminase
MNDDELASYHKTMTNEGFIVETTRRTGKILETCNLVVTATPSSEPLLFSAELRPGTHITAVGSDTPHKQELDAEILNRADVVVADSVPQCLVRGEIYQAIKAGLLNEDRLVELGALLSTGEGGRVRDNQITVADLTGVAVQDIKIAELVFQAVG